MNKNGFTLVELLSVIVVLAIIISLVAISYARMDDNITRIYYDGLRESLLISGSDYFLYHQNEKKVSLRKLINNNYIDKVVDQKGNMCDIDNSFINTYKDKFNNLNYEVCLKCGFEFNNLESDKCKYE